MPERAGLREPGSQGVGEPGWRIPASLLLLGVLLLPGSLTPWLPGPLEGQRAPVLQQIDVPHNYYYREMYLPQVTSGPSSVAWSPDGTELVYSMQGSLWRQRLGTTEATQLTDGPGYDYQPDWSPDGRHIVYTSYRNDALELWLLDTRDGSTRALVANGAVNLDPRWSPDGSRIAYVSTEYQKRWHVFMLTSPTSPTSPSVRLTADSLSPLPRYYYSRYDHFLSPTWSPDGKELILVSNRGHVWGSGGIWRMEVRPGGGPASEIRSEETTWKARPDWARDGKRVVYSSYLGRQRNQLWLTTATGGDPFQLTYCECDHTAPRWSPDGRRVAFISNEQGNTSLRVVSVPGGATETVTAGTRRYLHPTGRLRLLGTDAAGPTAVRLSVTGPDGRGWAPDTAWRHADEEFDRRERSFEFTYFHANGAATLVLPPGEYTVEVTKGLEYARVVRKVSVTAGKTSTESFRLERLIDLPARGWWSGDLHVHMNYGGAYRSVPARLRAQAEAEDLHVVENLIVNKEQRIPDVAMFRGSPDPISTARTIISHDEEYHTSWWGHTGHLGLTRSIMLPNYAGYANTAAASLFPDNATIADLTRAQGGISGYVHPFGPPLPDPASAPSTSALPVDVALGKVDYLEVMGFSDHRTTAEVWYRLLNAGFRIPAGAGTDAMTNFASLRGPVGLNRVYVGSGPTLRYRDWLTALKAGRTFVTNGPLLSFTLNGRPIGDELKLDAGVHRLVARVSLRSIVPVERLEIVANGVVVSPIPLTAGGTRADATIPLPVTRSGWFTVRAWSSRSTHPVLDLYPFATTSPIYVTIGGRAVRSAESARWFVSWIERLEAAANAHEGWNTPAEKAEVLKRLADAKAVFLARAGE